MMIKLGQFYKETAPVVSKRPSFNINAQIPVTSYLTELEIAVLDRRRDYRTMQPTEYGSVRISLDSLPFFDKKPCQFKLQTQGKIVNIELTIVSYNEVQNIEPCIRELKERVKNMEVQIEDVTTIIIIERGRVRA